MHELLLKETRCMLKGFLDVKGNWFLSLSIYENPQPSFPPSLHTYNTTLKTFKYTEFCSVNNEWDRKIQDEIESTYCKGLKFNLERTQPLYSHYSLVILARMNRYTGTLFTDNSWIVLEFRKSDVIKDYKINHIQTKKKDSIERLRDNYTQQNKSQNAETDNNQIWEWVLYSVKDR